jgi:hypothetical protein
VNTRGKPIRGVPIRAVQFSHDADGFVTDYRVTDEEPLLASAVSDEAGRYRLPSLPRMPEPIFSQSQVERCMAPPSVIGPPNRWSAR